MITPGKANYHTLHQILPSREQLQLTQTHKIKIVVYCTYIIITFLLVLLPSPARQKPLQQHVRSNLSCNKHSWLTNALSCHCFRCSCCLQLATSYTSHPTRHVVPAVGNWISQALHDFAHPFIRTDMRRHSTCNLQTHCLQLRNYIRTSANHFLTILPLAVVTWLHPTMYLSSSSTILHSASFSFRLPATFHSTT